MKFSYAFMMEWLPRGSWVRNSALRTPFLGVFVFLGAAAVALAEVPSPTSSLPFGIRVSISARKIKDGHMGQIRVRIPNGVSEAVSAEAVFGETPILFFEKSSSVSRSLYGLFAVPFNTPVGPNEIKVSLKIGESAREWPLKFDVVSGRYRGEVLPVDPKFVTLSPEDQSRIELEQKLVGDLYRKSAAPHLWGRGFRKPVKSRLTRRFGNRRMFNGELQSFHTGADLKAPMGTPVQAAAGGVVVLARDLFFTGGTVIVDHGLGLLTVYAHLSGYRVKEGQAVEGGQSIAESGSTGRSSGPHLHWGAVLNRVKFDPLDLLKGVP